MLGYVLIVTKEAKMRESTTEVPKELICSSVRSFQVMQLIIRYWEGLEEQEIMVIALPSLTNVTRT